MKDEKYEIEVKVYQIHPNMERVGTQPLIWKKKIFSFDWRRGARGTMGRMRYTLFKTGQEALLDFADKLDAVDWEDSAGDGGL